MRFSKGALELITIILLSSLHMARTAPTNDPQALQVRAGTSSPPDPKDDGLPKGDAKDLIPWTDDDFADEDYKNAPDYDPDQDADLDQKKRSDDLSLVKRANPEKGGTPWLRSVGVDGTEVREGFLNSDNKKFIGLTGTFGKDKQLGMLETTEEFVVPIPRPRGYKPWQADHVQDLGLYTAIASQDAPVNIAAKDWQTIKDAILGEEDENVTVPSENTKKLGKVLNDPNNIRGITYVMNALKNAIMKFAYSKQTTKGKWIKWNRSNTWGLYRYMKQTRPQFDEVTKRATSTIEGFITDKDSGSKIAKHYSDEVNRMYNKAITELERVLKDSTPEGKKSIFKADDCKNTKDSPNSPPAEGSGAPATPTAPTRAPSATVAPANPPARASCIANPSTPVKDSHEDELQKAAAFFCRQYASRTVTTANVNIAQTVISGTLTEGRQTVDVARLYTGTENEDDVYDISVKSVDGCTPVGGYDLGTPVADNQCPDILHNAWLQCHNNQGRGGAIVAGCLVYSISTKY